MSDIQDELRRAIADYKSERALSSSIGALAPFLIIGAIIFLIVVVAIFVAKVVYWTFLLIIIPISVTTWLLYTTIAGVRNRNAAKSWRWFNGCLSALIAAIAALSAPAIIGMYQIKVKKAHKDYLDIVHPTFTYADLGGNVGFLSHIFLAGQSRSKTRLRSCLTI